MRSLTVEPGQDGKTSRWLLLALVLIWGVWASFNYFVNEDAFISFRYVANLVDGEGLVYNPGVHDEAYSNLLWILVLAIPAMLGVPPEIAAPGLGILCGAGVLYLVWLLARRALPEKRWMPLAAPLMLAAWYPLVYWSGSGLETPFYTLLLLAATYFHLRRKPSRFPWTGLFLGAAVLTRPEGAAMIVVFAIHYLLYRKREEGIGSSWRDLALALMLVAVQIVFRRFYYGLWLPLPAYVKAGGSWEQILYGLGYLWAFLWPTMLLPLSVLGIWTIIKRLRKPVVGLALLLLFAQSAFIVYSGGDYMGRARFLVPVIPLLIVAVLMGLDDLGDRIKRLRSRILVFWGVVAMVCLWGLLDNAATVSYLLNADSIDLHNNRKRYSAQWLASVLPPEATLACGSAGALAYYSGLVNYDFAGLANAEAALSGERRVGSMAGHQLAYPDLIGEYEPWVVILNPNACDAETLGAWLSGETAMPGYPYECMSFPNSSVYDDPVLAMDYRPMFVEVADGLYLSFYARKGLPEEILESGGACPVRPRGGPGGR